MKGDFSRDSFDASRGHYRVLMQQGRVQLDADWNEAHAIVLHRLETLARDIFGSGGGPEFDCGFAIFRENNEANGDCSIGAGRYYVDGYLVENQRPKRYSHQAVERLASDARYVLYLDVWEEFVAPQADAALVDPALGGLDTAARTRLEWRVRAQRVDALPSRDEIADGWPNEILDADRFAPRGRLAASLSAPSADDDPASPTLEGGYRGADNQLYRIEIHAPGTAAGGATFKWSRDNGAVVAAIEHVAERVLTVGAFGDDAQRTFAPGDWVEICDDDDIGMLAPPRGLYAVAHVDPAARTIALTTPPAYGFDAAKHPLVRRWDQRSAPLPIVESEAADEDGEIPIEAGLAIRFAARKPGDAAPRYRSGDYWTVAARTAGGGILLWPHAESGNAATRPPAGVRHRYAPLAGISIDANGTFAIDRALHDYRRRFRPQTEFV